MRDSRRSRLVLTLLLVVATGLVTLEVRRAESSTLGALRDSGSAVFGPIERASAAVWEPIASLVDGRSQGERIEALRRENARLRAQLRSSRLARKQAGELSELRALAGRGRYRIVPAEVVAVRGAGAFEHTATIDVGARDGVEADMTVVSADGLVGRIVHVGTWTSRVLLATDSSSRVGARLEASNEIGIVRGRGSSEMRLRMLDVRAGVEPGHRLVTFGSQGSTPYVPGVPIGTVTSVQQRPGSVTPNASVRPFVDFSTLDLVGVVVRTPRQKPRDSVLPPKPTQRPRSSPEPASTAGTGSAAGTAASDRGVGS